MGTVNTYESVIRLGGSYGSNRSYSASSNASLVKKDAEAPWVALADPKNRVDTKKFRPPYKRPNGTVLNKQQFHEYVNDGCVFCEDHDIPWGEFILPLQDDLDGRHIFMCEACYKIEDNFECLQWMI